MKKLAELKNAMKIPTDELLRGLSFDMRGIDKEISLLKKWLGDRGAEKPPSDIIQEALKEFVAKSSVSSRRQALLLSHGLPIQIGNGGQRLIEDGARFQTLLAALNAYAEAPRALRPCYRGLLNAYFEYDPASGQSSGRENWRRLRTFLSESLPKIFVSGLQPTWVEVLSENRQLLGDDPGGQYGAMVLAGAPEQFDHVRDTFGIGGETWLVRQVVLGQVIAATKKNDAEFRGLIPTMLSLLATHRLVADAGFRAILDRHQSGRNPLEDIGLRDAAIERWGNPLLDANAARWSLVRPETKAMVADWLKLELIRKFFGLLAADGINDVRRVRFWERYYRSINICHFALGSNSYNHSGSDYKAIRKKMGSSLIRLNSTAASNNAFIMFIADYVFVEFGEKGNACYVYPKDKMPFSLNRLEISGDGDGLKNVNFRDDKLNHTDSGSETWESRFERTIYQLTSVRPSTPPPTKTEAERTSRPTAAASPASKPSPAAPGRLTAAQSDMSDTARRMLGESSSFSMADLRSFCASYNVKIDDLRDKNGSLWVRAHDRVPRINTHLQAWGFRFKDKKGWYWTGTS